jgi:diketogulonate reductase-like aldo/keto reductase
MHSVLLSFLQGPDVFPIPGTKRIKYLKENAAAYFVELTAEDKTFLEDTFHEDKVSRHQGCTLS